MSANESVTTPNVTGTDIYDASVVVGIKRNPSLPWLGSAGGYRTGADLHHSMYKVIMSGHYFESTSIVCCTNSCTGTHAVY